MGNVTQPNPHRAPRKPHPTLPHPHPYPRPHLSSQYAALDAKVLLLIRQQLVDTGAAPAWQQSQQSQQSSSPLPPLAGLAGVVAGASWLGLPVRLVPAVESAAAEFEVPSGAEVLPASIGRGQIVAKSLALVVEPDHSSCPCAGEGHGHDACLSPEPGLVMCVLALERTRLCFASVRAVLAEHGLTGAGGPLGAGCVRMASKTELVRYTGLVAGTVGPVLPGESRRRPVLLVDEALVDAAKGGLLLLGSGERRCHLALTAEELGGEALGGRVGALSVSS